MLKEFKEFAIKGNVVDLAVGIIIGLAFGKIVASFVNDILMPPIGLLLGRTDFSNLFIALGAGTFATIAEAKKAGVATINYGIFINTMTEFLIVAFAVFVMIQQINRMKPKPAAAVTNTKACPYCTSSIPLGASRCPMCTSQIS